MSNDNNNKQPLDHSESLPVFDKVQAPYTTTVNVGDVDLGIREINRVAAALENLVQWAEASTTTPTVNKLDYDGISLVERRSRDVNQTPFDKTIRFLLECAKRGYKRGNQFPPSICKVPRILRDLSESSFIPQLVSIGPIHRENEKLQEFEWQKECYLDDLLGHCDSTPKETLEACLKKVNDLIPAIRESYADMIENYSDDELARMMVMDGCFILEFCFKHEDEHLYWTNKMQNTRIAMDLMLLENQVPFFVLQALFECSIGNVSFTLSKVLDKYLAPYIKVFCPLSPEIFSRDMTRSLPYDLNHDHVLGYLHKRYRLVAAKSSNPAEKAAFHSIVELDRSGMNFKPHKEDEWSMTINFRSSLFPCLPWFGSKSTILMPTLVIDDATELILRNFIAYEQLFPQDRYYFTSYACAMDKLIDTQEDIAKLVESKVLVNALGSNQEAADMINKICKNIYISDFCYNKAFKQMDTYYNGFWPKHIARLRRVYFSNPWSVIALLVGFIVFLATVVSAIFAILQYFG